MDATRTQMSLGSAGLVLSCLSVLSLIFLLPRSDNLAVWFIATSATFAGWVGLVFCIVGLFSKVGRVPALAGLVVFGLIVAIRFAVVVL
ncbi:MAG: hypothetical protein L0211_07620 [Planctomycetaceae bacterium]|nr:hypothetical protein [Planctomycetaceae bacterium]